MPSLFRVLPMMFNRIHSDSSWLRSVLISGESQKGDEKKTTYDDIIHIIENFVHNRQSSISCFILCCCCTSRWFTTTTCSSALIGASFCSWGIRIACTGVITIACRRWRSLSQIGGAHRCCRWWNGGQSSSSGSWRLEWFRFDIGIVEGMLK